MKKIIYILILFLFFNLALAFTVDEIITGHLVRYPSGTFNVQNFAPIIEAPEGYIGDPGDLVSVSPDVMDPNGDNFTIEFGAPLNSSGQWQSTEDDEGIFYAIQKIRDKNVVSNVQLYLDLYNYKGRGREQAEYLRDKAIKL